MPAYNHPTASHDNLVDPSDHQEHDYDDYGTQPIYINKAKKMHPTQVPDKFIAEEGGKAQNPMCVCGDCFYISNQADHYDTQVDLTKEPLFSQPLNRASLDFRRMES